MIDWIRSWQVVLAWLTAGSIVILVASLVLVPFFVIRIPPDYFAPEKDHKHVYNGRNFVLRRAAVILRNILGYTLIIAGICMLVLPGQGLLTIFVGIMLLDFPGKKRFERWIVSRRPVRESINWIRRRAGRAPLVLEEKP